MINKESRKYFNDINDNLHTIAQAKADIKTTIYNLEKLGFSNTTINNLNDIIKDINNLDILNMKNELIKLFKEVVKNEK